LAGLAGTLLPATPLTGALLAATLLARVREVTAGILKIGRGLGQVAVDVDVSFGTLNGLTKTVKCLARGGVVALGEALSGVPQGRACCAAGLTRGRLELGQSPGKLLALGRGEVLQLLAELLQVLGGRLGVTVLVGVGLSGGGTGQ
jgi:hypothetical protein